MSNIITVSGLNLYAKTLLESDSRLKNIWLKGEISNLTDHYRFSEQRSAGCCMDEGKWRNAAPSAGTACLGTEFGDTTINNIQGDRHYGTTL